MEADGEKRSACTQSAHSEIKRERGGGSCLKHTFFKFHQLASLETFGGSAQLIFADKMLSIPFNPSKDLNVH